MTVELKPGITLYFSRHGQTVANVERRFSGRKDTPLTALGRRQACEIGAVLKRELGARPALSFVSSPFARARATMEIARETLGLPADGYITDPRIQEIDLGIWDQLTDAQARALDPVLFDAREADKWNVAVPGGENYAQVAARARSWAQSLAADTFAVSHGAFIRILRGLLLGLDVEHMARLDEPQGVVFRVRGRAVEMLPPAADAAQFPQRVG